ncbi:hypothetical protein BU15DRAFT_60222 [Melanogaster broomeanus]|nr:hypothetical protein BU15DRAFT_60222 [Melanogaster broomeanus]
MSSPPPNPDTRKLPPGWIEQYNWEFYVHLAEQRSSWEHPLGPIPQGFAPPPGPPPPDRGYSRSPYSGGPGGYQNPPQGYGGYNPSYQPSYGGPPNYSNAPQGEYGAYGRPQQGYPENRGFFGGGGGQQTGYAQAPPQKKGPGMGTALLAGGAGLVGGALLMDAIEDHDDHEREEGYDQGYQDGNDQDGFGGGDFGGGDFGGGDCVAVDQGIKFHLQEIRALLSGLIKFGWETSLDHSASDNRSVYSRRDDPQCASSSSSAITPAQAYARAIKTGERYDRSLYYTIERKQPEKRTEPQVPPLQNSGPERGASYARRLYASALSNKSPTSPLDSTSTPPPNMPASPPPILPIGGGRQSSRSARNSSRSPSLFDTGTEFIPTFNPADFYHSSVASHGPSLGTSAGPDPSVRRPCAPMSVSPSPLAPYPPSLAVRPPPRITQSQSLPEVASRPRDRPDSHQTQTESRTAIQAPVAYDLRIVHEVPSSVPSIETLPSDVPIVDPTAVANATSRPPSPYVQHSAEILPVCSPPPFEEHGIYRVPTEEGAGNALILAPSPASDSRDDGFLENLLSPLPELGHEEVPLYSLVDEQHPPPAFGDLHTTSGTVLSLSSAVAHLDISSPSPSSSSSLPPSPLFPHDTMSHPLQKAPSYALRDPVYSSVGSSQHNPDGGIPSISISSTISKPTQQSWQSLLPPETTQIPPSAQEVPHAFGMERYTMASGRSSSRSLAAESPGSVRLMDVTGETKNVDDFTHAIYNMTGGSSSRRSPETSSLAYEDVSGGQSRLGGTSQIVDMYGAGAKRVLQEAYELHEETAGEARFAIPRSALGLPQEVQRKYPGYPQTNDPRTDSPKGSSASIHSLSSQYSLRVPITVPHLDPGPPAYSHDAPRIDIARTMVSQLGGTAAAPKSRSYADRPRTTSKQPNSHHSIDRYMHGPQTPFAPVVLKEQDGHQQQHLVMPSLDPMQGHDYVAPPSPNGLQAWHTSQTPQASLYSQE